MQGVSFNFRVGVELIEEI